MERNRKLDIIKGICILFVIITHFEWTEAQRNLYLFPFWIGMAVPFFWLVSGYVYTASYQKKQVNTLDGAYAGAQLLKPFLRFTVPFLMIYLLEAFWALLKGIFTAGGLSLPELGDLALGLIRGGFGPGSYYYPILVQFLFLFPVIYLLVKKYGEKGLAVCFALNLFFEVGKLAFYVSNKNWRLLICRYVFVIAFGCYSYLYKERKLPKKYWAGMLAGIAFLTVIKYFGYKPQIFKWWTGTCMLAVLYVLPLFFVYVNGKKQIRWKFRLLDELGKASYNIFLVQMVYYKFATMYVGKLTGGNRPLWLGINLVLCLALGYGFYKIETPITKKVIARILPVDKVVSR